MSFIPLKEHEKQDVVEPPTANTLSFSVQTRPLKQSPNKSQDDEQIAINTDLISLNVSVTDAQGRAVLGLDKRAFTVLDNKVPQEIKFFSDMDAPISIGIIFDTSGSMTGNRILQSKEALAHFIQTSHPQDEFFLIGFNSNPQLLIDRTRDADAVLNKLTYVQPHGNTALIDAIYLGIQKLQQGAHSKHALLLITDGGENSSRYSSKEVRRLLKESNVTLYAIGIVDLIELASKAGARVQHLLDGLSEVSGGRTFYPQSSNEMDQDFERVALELRHQYSIGYKPEYFIRDGKWHRIKVRVRPLNGSLGLVVRSREGYYALPYS